ncbi:MAG: 3-phosphoserine/phosphohydroxythreonine transaminase [Planctomycetaceae bacterium]|jgi:phosphoserine aminotransferase|nr:3-phosphoserine/phosphohydroxythreonine transaminase [Planctomycetaceae bacterium]
MPNYDRTFNFSAGPAGLPLPVLEQAQLEMLNFRSCGASILEISHRSATFSDVLDSARNGIRQLLGANDDFEVLFLQGGSRLQFSMVPINLLQSETDRGNYVVTGTWSDKALQEAANCHATDIIWSGQKNGYSDLPDQTDLQSLVTNDAAYVYYTSNETIQGIQFQDDLSFASVPTICDASSDLLSRPIDINKYGMIYACAQKNAGPAGVTIVVIRKDLLNPTINECPSYLNYRNHADANSMYNTPPTFAIYMVDLVCQWLLNDIGGLEKMNQINRKKAELLYAAIDERPDMYSGHAAPANRSLMNVTFRLPSQELTDLFLKQANDQGLTSLQGHRSVGGIRASIYNSMPHEGVLALRDFMNSFYTQHSCSR